MMWTFMAGAVFSIAAYCLYREVKEEMRKQKIRRQYEASIAKKKT